MSIDVNVQNDLVIVTESSEDITVNVSNAAGPAGVGVPVGGSTGQVLKKQSGTDYDTFWALDGVGVPYSGATGDVNLGTHRILAQNATIASSGSGDTFTLNHSSGSGIGLNITKGGNGEGLYVNKTSGSGNAATIIGTLNATTLVKSGGTSSQFLKADGSVDSTTYVGGSGATGQVAYWNGTNSQTGSNNLFWDAANSRLTVGAAFAGTQQNFNVYSGALFQQVAGDNNKIYIGNNASLAANDGRLLITPYIIKLNTPSDTLRISGDNINLGANLLLNGRNLDAGSLVLNAASIDAFKIFGATRNVLLQNGGAFTDGGQRLQVQGDAFIRGSGATSATNALTVQNSSSTNLFRLRNDGVAILGSGGALYLAAANDFLFLESTTGSGSKNNFVSYLQTSHTSGTNNGILSNGQYTISSGSGVWNLIHITPGINQTGTATGITRGLYVNPGLTAAADWRSIEWSNNSGWGLYGAGTAPNVLNGALTLNSTLFVGAHISFYTSIRDNRFNDVITQSVNTLATNRTLTIGNATYTIVNINNPRLIVGGTTDSGEKLQVNGTARVSGDALVNGLTVGKGTGSLTLNTALGFQALNANTTGNNNTAIGYAALQKNTSGGSNTAIGVGSSLNITTGSLNTSVGVNSCGNITTGNNNTGIGHSAILLNTTGTDNTAIGLSALSSNLTGQGNTSIGVSSSGNLLGNFNTAIGLQALRGSVSSTGSNNIGIGRISLFTNTTGESNVAIGNISMADNNTGSENSALGGESLSKNISGSQNVAVGRFAGNKITGGATDNSITNNSIYIGYNTKALANNQTNQIVIGHNETGLGSNTTIIGNSSTTLTALRGSLISGGTSVNSSAQVQVDSTTKGFLPPRMTNAQRTAISSPAVGLIVYCTDAVEGLYVYKSMGWTFVI
jgi:hypothetical protein